MRCANTPEQVSTPDLLGGVAHTCIYILLAGSPLAPQLMPTIRIQLAQVASNPPIGG